jgi:hypothetical protein
VILNACYYHLCSNVEGGVKELKYILIYELFCKKLIFLVEICG